MTPPEPRPNRRELLALGVGAFVVSAALPGRTPRRRFRRRAPLMGTTAEIVVVSDDAAHARAAIDDALDVLRHVDRTMSRHRPASDVGRVNEGAATEAVPVGADTARVLREAVSWAEATEGRFDPCLARATVLWDDPARRTPPNRAAYARLAERRLYRALDVDTFDGRPAVRLTDADAGVDLGGIAKGWGVDRAASVLRSHGIGDALVNVGGDLVALGRSEDGDPWSVGVRDPQQPHRLAGRFDLEDAAAATSGDYARGFDHGGRRYHHLLDPRTAAPRTSDTHAVTVVADDCLTADAAATAAFGLDREAAKRLLAPRARVV
jgi:thiamine biosynthesis lipoprotein